MSIRATMIAMQYMAELRAASFRPSELDEEYNPDQPTWILGLPDELLCAVLETVAKSDPPRKPKDTNLRNDDLGFLRLSEVCTRFRVLLLSMPGIWADVAFKLPLADARLALSRSQFMPLTVHVGSSLTYSVSLHPEAPMRECNVELAAENAARIRRITFVSAQNTSYKQLLNKPLPKLETLMLLEGRNFMDPQQPFEIGKIHINAPTLRQMYIDLLNPAAIHAFENGVTFGCPAMQSLDITIEAENSQDILSPRWIADVLKTVPLLRHLTFKFEINSAPFDWIESFHNRPAQLEHLQSLELRGTPAANIADLHRCLGSPRPARRILRLDHPHQRYDDTSVLPPADGAIINTATAFGPLFQHPSHDVLLVKLDRIENKSFIFASNDDPIHELTLRLFSAADPSSKDIVELTMRSILSSDSPVYGRVADILAQALTHSAVRQLIIDAPGNDGWLSLVQPIVASCAAVKQLVIYGNVTLPNDTHSLPVLDMIFFRPQQRYNSRDKMREDIRWDQLISWLKARSEAGLRLRRLCVRGFDTSKVDKRAGAKEKDKAMCLRVAKFVDEFVDERKGKSSASA